MNVSTFLTLLCLGIASAFPRVDHTFNAQSNLFEGVVDEVSGMVEELIDAISDVLVEESPKVLDTHSEEQSEEQQSNRTASNHSGDISLLIRPPRKILGKSKGTTRRLLGKIFKGLGKKIVGAFKKTAPKLKKFGKRIGEEVLVNTIIPEGLGKIVQAIGDSVLGDNNPPVTPEDSDYGDETNEEF